MNWVLYCDNILDLNFKQSSVYFPNFQFINNTDYDSTTAYKTINRNRDTKPFVAVVYLFVFHSGIMY